MADEILVAPRTLQLIQELIYHVKNAHQSFGQDLSFYEFVDDHLDELIEGLRDE